jgi:transcriptional regulator with XRE-family HTH domain
VVRELADKIRALRELSKESSPAAKGKGRSIGDRALGTCAMTGHIDDHVGKRLRRRRRLLGLTQQCLAEAIGLRFQQIQKYECGANRVTASRLFQLARALNVPTSYFFDGLPDVPSMPRTSDLDPSHIPSDVLAQSETIELIRAYYQLGERPRRKLLDLAKSLREDGLSPI